MEFFKRKPKEYMVTEEILKESVRREVITIMMDLFVKFFEENVDDSKACIEFFNKYVIFPLTRQNLTFRVSPFDRVAYSREEYDINLIGTRSTATLDLDEEATVVFPPLYDLQTGELVEKGFCYKYTLDKNMS